MTRGERRTLLLVSAIGIVMETTGLVPTKITTFGIEFSETDRTLLLRLSGAVVLYFLVAFVVYASSDLVAWWGSMRDEVLEKDAQGRADEWATKEGRGLREVEHRQMLREAHREARSTFFYKPLRQRLALVLEERTTASVSLGRAALEFAFPVVLGLYTVTTLFR